MQLRPCDQCKRHVDRDTARCPFCAAALSSLPSRLVAHAARVSRAAVFASAAACGSSTPAQQYSPPPPPPPDPVVVQKFAQAPAPTAGKGSVRGFLTVDGRPLADTRIDARHESGTRIEIRTGSHGEYELVDVEPGRWELMIDYQFRGGRPQDTPPPPMENIVIAADANQRMDIPLQSPPPPTPDRGPCCKPYGAPPARRRLV